MPATRMTFAFSATDAGSQLRSVTYFDSVEALEQLTAMGMVEGATMAMSQLDAVLADLREYAQGKGTQLERSEEHTSELQSLMRISYAVFCLKQKKKQHNKTPNKT